MNAMSDKVTQSLTIALRGLALRQAAIAGNIANVDTPGYKATRVSFEEALQRAVQPKSGLPFRFTDGGRPQAADGDDAPLNVQPTVETVTSSFRNDGNSVDIDQEMVQLADTTLRYGAVARLLSDRVALMRSIITEGRR